MQQKSGEKRFADEDKIFEKENALQVCEKEKNDKCDSIVDSVLPYLECVFQQSNWDEHLLGGELTWFGFIFSKNKLTK